MCKKKLDATDPPPRRTSSSAAPFSSTSRSATATDSSAAGFSSSKASASSTTSLSSIRSSLPDNPLIYSCSEISSATNNFLSKRLSSSSSTPSWRCSLRGKDVVVFQRKLHRRLVDLRPLLSSLCKSHHSSIIPLRGASLSGDHIYLVYDFVSGASLSDCLRNPNLANYTVLNTWLSRLQIATDLADGLHYIHRSSGLDIRFVHNHLKSSSVIVSDPHLHAKICHFGTAQLTGELPDSDVVEEAPQSSSSSSSSAMKKRSKSREMKLKGTIGYMAPEFSRAGIVSQKADVYAFGVVLLELLSGEEPTKHRYDKTQKSFVTTSVIESAREAIDAGEGRIRQWVDRRLRDSFPVNVAERLTRVALDCVHVEEDKRPDMERVAGKVSRMYLESQAWAEKMRIPTDFSVSMGPR